MVYRTVKVPRYKSTVLTFKIAKLARKLIVSEPRYNLNIFLNSLFTE